MERRNCRKLKCFHTMKTFKIVTLAVKSLQISMENKPFESWLENVTKA